MLLETVLLALVEDGVTELFALDGSEGRRLERDELAVETDHRGSARADVQVCAARVEHGLEELVQIDGCHGCLVARKGAHQAAPERAWTSLMVPQWCLRPPTSG